MCQLDTETVQKILGEEREATRARVQALTTTFDEIVSSSVDANADDEHDPEGSTIAFERAQVSALLAEALSAVEDISRASARLAQGTYGTCTRCGRAIAPERLRARPSAECCVTCAGSAGRI
jgi:RNA polymerase-binding transcription factor DksA